MFANNPPRVKFAHLRTRDIDVPVSQHAAYDLSTMADMVKNGVAISTSNMDSQYFDGTDTSSFNLPLEFQRGVDINDAWNASKDSKHKLSKAKVTNFNINPTQTS